MRSKSTPASEVIRPAIEPGHDGARAQPWK